MRLSREFRHFMPHTKKEPWRAITLLMLAACGLCHESAALETVTIFYWGNDWEMAAAGDLIQDFEQLHNGADGKPAIKVIMGQSASIDMVGDPQRLLCAIAGGDPPDVVFFDRYAVSQWVARGTLESLQPFLERDWAERPDDPFTLRPEQFYEHCWREACYNGELYAVPTDTDNRAMYYNIDLLEKHGAELIAAGCVDPDDPDKVGPPRTWRQLKAAARILTEYDAHGHLDRVGFIPNYGNSWLYLYGWLNGGEFMSPDGRMCTLNAPEIVDALVFMTEVYDIMGGAKAVSAFQSSMQGGGLSDLFVAGKVAMRIDCDGFLRTIANVKRDLRFGVALPPAPEGKPQFGWSAGWSWVMPKGVKHPEEAWLFLKYLASKRAYTLRADAMLSQARAAGNVFIPRVSARRDLTEWAMERYLYNDPTVDDKFKEAIRTFLGAMSVSKFLPVTPVGQLLWHEQVRAMESGIYKENDPNDLRRNAQLALDRSTQIVQEALDRILNPAPYPELRWRPVIIGYLTVFLIGAGAVLWHFQRKVRARGFFRREFYAGYAFASPWFLGFLVFGGGPIVFSLIMSFCQYDVFSAPRFVGAKNYIEMFTNDPLFYKSLGNTLFMAIGIPLSMAVGLGIALLLNYEIRGMAVYRTFFYLPAIMPAVAASILWMWIFNPQQGVLNTFLLRVGVSPPSWLQDKSWAKPALILMSLWSAGGGMIIWLAGLKGIPKHLYEAARIDGAGRIRQFWNITLPMLSPYIFFNMVMGLIHTFQIFTQAYIMTGGGPVDATLFYVYALFNNAFRYMRMGYASAMAWVLFAIVLGLTAIQLTLSKRWVHYETAE